MRDKRPVDELSIEELERILAVRKREARMQQMERMKRDGRVVVDTRTPKFALEPTEIAKPQPDLTPSPVSAPQPASTPTLSMATAAVTGGSVQAQFEDEDDGAIAAPAQPTRTKAQSRQAMNRVLLLVEVAAVIGIVAIGFSLFQAVGTLERETEAAQRLSEEQRRAGIPTLAPTPTIRLENIVLPTGHIYSDQGIVEFNMNEIPANLRPVVQSQLLQPVLDRPAPTAETAQRIVIPKLNVDQVIVPGTDPEALRLGVGQLINGVNANDNEGNLVLAAHNDIYGEIFRYLDQLEAGDSFIIYTQVQTHEYIVASVDIVQPNDVWVMENQPGRAMATLISCYPYQVNDRRIVVFADRVS
jgi:sortase A